MATGQVPERRISWVPSFEGSSHLSSVIGHERAKANETLPLPPTTKGGGGGGGLPGREGLKQSSRAHSEQRAPAAVRAHRSAGRNSLMLQCAWRGRAAFRISAQRKKAGDSQEERREAPPLELQPQQCQHLLILHIVQIWKIHVPVLSDSEMGQMHFEDKR